MATVGVSNRSWFYDEVIDGDATVIDAEEFETAWKQAKVK
jgi:hypothetical protein